MHKYAESCMLQHAQPCIFNVQFNRDTWKIEQKEIQAVSRSSDNATALILASIWKGRKQWAANLEWIIFLQQIAGYRALASNKPTLLVQMCPQPNHLLQTNMNSVLLVADYVLVNNFVPILCSKWRIYHCFNQSTAEHLNSSTPNPCQDLHLFIHQKLISRAPCQSCHCKRIVFYNNLITNVGSQTLTT